MLPKSRELDKLLDQISDWNFPIFDACEHGNILTQVRAERLYSTAASLHEVDHRLLRCK